MSELPQSDCLRMGISHGFTSSFRTESEDLFRSTAEEVMYEESEWEPKPECVTDPQERFSTVLPALCLGIKLGESGIEWV